MYVVDEMQKKNIIAHYFNALNKHFLNRRTNNYNNLLMKLLIILITCFNISKSSKVD